MKLKRLEELTLGKVWVGTNYDGDPSAVARGYYEIPAVSLTAECSSYDPEFILAWLPEERCFGSWDPDHWVLKVFRKARWEDIVESPARYLHAQWNPDSKLGIELRKPWLKYVFKAGRPY